MSVDALDHRFAEVNGIRLHDVTAGRGPLMVFVHGFPEFWYEWRRQLVEFGRDHQAVAPDMRGYNLSGKPVDLSPYRVPNMVEDLRAWAFAIARIERFVPDLRIERIPDGSHWAVNEQPEGVNRLIRDVLGPRRAAAKEAR
jgi:pimeloyl-ACP methyl ester carboxylesterase